MATKPILSGLAGAHTAGIYADMTVDGPEIGDLVVVLDKAKNLPNRRTIGKQDPYCAARLGKEAKKTETDKRGGQTPRWDQELRFTVHDSPDYRQLKVSVFNDDKKTDLIGEAWVHLDSVLQRGGGHADGWHALQCRGKYAGEIRIELTYYDTRPKEEPPPPEPRKEKSKARAENPARNTVGGPRQGKQTTRRPLPIDPASTATATTTTTTSSSSASSATAVASSSGPSPAPAAADTHHHPPPARQAPLRALPQPAASHPRQSHPEPHTIDRPAPDRSTPYSAPSILPKEPGQQPYPTSHESAPEHGATPYAHRQEQVLMAVPVQHVPRPAPLRPAEARSEDHSASFHHAPDALTVYRHSHSQQPPLPPHHLPRHQPETVTTGSYYPPQSFDYEPAPARTVRHAATDMPLPQAPSGGIYSKAQPAPQIRHHHSAPDYQHALVPVNHIPRRERWEDPFVTDAPPTHAPHPPVPRHQARDAVLDDIPDTIPYESSNDSPPPPPPVHRSSDSQLVPAGFTAYNRYGRPQQPTAPPNNGYGPGGAQGRAQEPWLGPHAPYSTSPSLNGAPDYAPPAQREPIPPPYEEPSSQHGQPEAPPTAYWSQEQQLPASLLPGYDERHAAQPSMQALRGESRDDGAWAGSLAMTRQAPISTAPPPFSVAPAVAVAAAAHRPITSALRPYRAYASYADLAGTAAAARHEELDPPPHTRALVGPLSAGVIENSSSYSFPPPATSTATAAVNTSAPANSATVTPDPPRVRRKSVSPRPTTATSEHSGIGGGMGGMGGSNGGSSGGGGGGVSRIPFGPDSYDALNPHAASSPSAFDAFGASGAQYRTPEEAEEAYWRHTRGVSPDEPIIGSDGRVIDPSDHLATDTWAPEPERKTPNSTAATTNKSVDETESRSRSRSAPLSAQSLPQLPPSSRRSNRDFGGGADGSSPLPPPYSLVGGGAGGGGGDVAINPPAMASETARRSRMPRNSRGGSVEAAGSPMPPQHVPAYANGSYSSRTAAANAAPRSVPRGSAGAEREDYYYQQQQQQQHYYGRNGGGSNGGSPAIAGYLPYDNHNNSHYNHNYTNDGVSHSPSPSASSSALVVLGGAAAAAVPPPVPAKVPISATAGNAGGYGGGGGGGGNNYVHHDDYAALSEELRSIDIGSGAKPHHHHHNSHNQYYSSRRTTRRIQY